ncbi:MAG: BNR-4 repeat-containing protein [Verrucomicrobiota bacterium]
MKIAFAFVLFMGVLTAGRSETLPTDDGYRGIWYYNQPSKDEYKFKYSGGMATYPQQHIPIAIYRKEANKTFFVFGGTTARKAGDKQELLHMVSYYDHATGVVPRPRILLNKKTDDAHDNPTLAIDDAGHLWIFSSSHGTSRPSFIHRSTKPYSIEEFERIQETNFSYTQPWYLPGQGFLFLHTRYNGGKSLGLNAVRCLFWMTSKDGRQWNEPKMLAGIVQGDYQISWTRGSRLATAFDFHPQQGGLNARANIYYLETRDFGQTWQTITGKPVTPPLSTERNPALVYDSRQDKELVYLKDLNFDAQGNPIILFLTSKGYEAGPTNDPRTWHTLRWTGKAWEKRSVTQSLNNYDHGSLYIESDGTWRIIGPTERGPQPYNPGGEMAMWVSNDRGTTWAKARQLTSGSSRNHTYARRPVNAHPDFYAFWADGHARQSSESYLYFTNQKGDAVWRLPAKLNEDFGRPEPAVPQK